MSTRKTSQRNVRSGRGVLTFPDGPFYIGEWENDCMTRGRFIDGGVIYDGTWSRHNPATGTITWPNGIVVDVVDSCCVLTTYEQYMTACMMHDGRTVQECNLATDPISWEPVVVNETGQPRLVAPLLFHIDKLSERGYKHRLKLQHLIFARDAENLHACPECRFNYDKTHGLMHLVQSKINEFAAAAAAVKIQRFVRSKRSNRHGSRGGRRKQKSKRRARLLL
jgi:hypothetical protein